jgi:transposase InsO family protein
LGLHRSSGRYQNKGPTQWLLRLGERLEALSRKHPRLGYRKLTRLLRAEGWKVGKKLVQRLRRECGLRVKRWRPRRRRRGQSTGAIPTRAEGLNHVWSWDFVADRTDNGGRLRILSLIDEHSRECLALHVARKLTAHDLVEVMERLVAERGAPEHIRSDNGSEFIARILRDWLARRGVKTLYIEPGSPWQNGFVESFHGRFRDECLNREQLWTLTEARVVIEDYRNKYNQKRPHSRLGYQSPARYAASLLPSLAPVRPAEPGLPSARDGQPASGVSTSINHPDRL